ncbi:MAG: xanthine dehydrogenase family protein molybdopterin-binding subunit [Proteobacteria bacterium]|nr:xanthine dehydrogenase family protein molybdopterin-binding subunit [Pseudomonadota bacterium]
MKPEKTGLTRRQMIRASTAAGAGLMVGFHLPGCSNGATISYEGQIRPDGNFVPNAWIRIDRHDTVTVMVNHSEMGQGVLTALPMIVAEEMDADWDKVRSEHAPVADVYKNPMMNMQITAGSTSVRTTWEILRQAGASVRRLFVEAAAQTWRVPPDECSTEKSRVVHGSSGRKLRYGELLEAAAGLPMPENVTVKPPAEFDLIGRSVPRLDSAAKTDGSAVFGVDVQLPGLLVATVAHPPVIGSKAVSVDYSEALKIPGVKDVLTIGNGVAVVAETFWQALKGKRLLKIQWTQGNRETADTAVLKGRWRKMAENEGDTTYEKGDVDDVAEAKGRVVEADYELPFQAHATAEPMNCTADVRPDRCEVWVPTQNQGGSHAMAVYITGLDPEVVKIHTTFVGGGFGRRADADFVAEAVEISHTLKKPVKVVWTREEDMTTDVYRPASFNRMKAVVDEGGRPVAWIHRMVGPDHFVQFIPKFVPAMTPSWFPGFMKRGAASLAGSLMNTFGAGKGLLGGAGPLPYDIDNVRIEFLNDDVGIPVGFWRSVANSSNGFVVESFVDELAQAAGKDPYRFRLELLQGNPRLQHVLKLAAEKSSWEKPPPKGLFRGITAHVFHDTLISMVAEISVADSGEIVVHRIVCAVDCGQVIHPKIIQAQMESGIAFGLTATLKSSVTFSRGKPDQSNFNDFEILRMNEMPTVETHIVPSAESPTGIGEAAVPTVAPAVANAVFAATGKRIRKLPITREDLV